MKRLNKIFVLLLSLTLLVSFVACSKKNNNDKTQGENSKPTVSTPSTTTEESRPEKENKPDTPTPESKPQESNPEPSTPSTPVVTQKPASTLILGKWKTKVDACEILIEHNIELVGPIYIDAITKFDRDLSYSVDIEPVSVTDILKAALPDYDEGFIQNCVSILSDAIFESGVYKFEDEKFLIMLDGDPDYTEMQYSFTNSDNKLVLYVTSDVREYERIS